MKFNVNILRYGKYCVVGGAGAITDFLIYTTLVIFFSINYLLANIISITVALTLVYILQKKWTFQYTVKKGSRTFQRYLVSVAITYILNNSVLVLLVAIFGYSVIISKVIQIVLSMIWGYCLTNYIVFNPKWDDK